jgi:uncharacterized membrane protein YeaQ/YmgE (transglycosylase-associated protein family)
MDLLWAIIIGIVAGWLAGVLVKGRGFGLFGNLIVGIVGAVIGSAVFGMLDMPAYGTAGVLAMSTVGAVILLALASLAKRA